MTDEATKHTMTVLEELYKFMSESHFDRIDKYCIENDDTKAYGFTCEARAYAMCAVTVRKKMKELTND